MNTQAIQDEINSIIEANRSRIGGRAARNQHRIAKHQENTLRELGILDMVPNAPYSKYIGHSDAAAVIAAAQDAGGKVYVSSFDDVSKSAPSNLYTLLNETEDETADEDIDQKLAELEYELDQKDWEAKVRQIDEIEIRRAFEVDDDGYYI